MLNIDKLAKILDTPWFFSSSALLISFIIFMISAVIITILARLDKIGFFILITMFLMTMHVFSATIYTACFTDKTEDVLGRYEYNETSSLVTLRSGDDVRVFNKIKLDHNYIKLVEIKNGLGGKEELTLYDTELNEIERLTKK